MHSTSPIRKKKTGVCRIESVQHALTECRTAARHIADTHVQHSVEQRSDAQRRAATRGTTENVTTPVHLTHVSAPQPRVSLFLRRVVRRFGVPVLSSFVPSSSDASRSSPSRSRERLRGIFARDHPDWRVHQDTSGPWHRSTVSNLMFSWASRAAVSA